MRIIKYRPQYQKYFEQLNRAWIEKYFQMEQMDEILLSNPTDTILKDGGQIFFVEHQNQIIGTVALVFISKDVYELAKMAVDERFRSLGAGGLLCRTAIEEARKLNARKLILFTNSSLKTAIRIYHKFGFKDVHLDGQEYSRADIKMELLLEAQPFIKWFDKTFDFNFDAEQFSDLLECLEENSSRVPELINGIPDLQLNTKRIGKWSIKEHIGHLLILEPLWQRRFSEIKENKIGMSPADLNNRATDEAVFNQYGIEKIITDFQQQRKHTIRLLKSFSKEDLHNSLYHPRLNQPMRIVDLMYFVGEHDEHHCNVILKIRNDLINL
ncbi:GNAT family N-acetyltransferase [Sphingobacterium sp. SGR-19]|uniref:GNAT family N-acetyltransferase n=1 Tax=Sphingobacterium sp. SGR-19 TaxID=2710886 RepID=UPI0013EBAC68|nr:GNAT family N-acetyltransferase [Sphingobacterium sp. SGR-19]NGM65134.1 GNAT family N-acetyltransferase [Sphingobacterium sp. SGR-19]